MKIRFRPLPTAQSADGRMRRSTAPTFARSGRHRTPSERGVAADVPERSRAASRIMSLRPRWKPIASAKVPGGAVRPDRERAVDSPVAIVWGLPPLFWRFVRLRLSSWIASAFHSQPLLWLALFSGRFCSSPQLLQYPERQARSQLAVHGVCILAFVWQVLSPKVMPVTEGQHAPSLALFSTGVS